MSTQLAPFSFEGQSLRVVTDDKGQPWFVAADVLASLQLDGKALERLDADEKGVSSVHTPGGDQDMTTVNEPGLYALILGSSKAEAKRFKRWVTHDVIPAIRKTGAYLTPGTLATLPAPTHDRVSAILLIGEAVAKVPGVKAGIAAAAILTCIQENTGITTEVLRRALPAANEPMCALNATPFAPKFSSAPVDKQVEPMVDKPAVTIPASEAKPAVLPLAKGPDVREKSGEKMPEKLPEKSARIEKPLEKLVPKESDAKRTAAILAGQSDLSSANSAQFLGLIGAFSNEANVKNIRTKLSEQGIKTFSEPLDTPQGKKTRVRAGPFASREAADKALEKMQKIGVSGVVSAKQ